MKEGAEGDRDVNGEKLDIDKEFKSDDGSKEISPDDSTLLPTANSNDPFSLVRLC